VKLTVDDPPLPLEQVDPVLANHFLLVANKRHPIVRTILIEAGMIHIRCHSGKWIHKKIPFYGT
jgi:hypothetical protein